MAEVADGRVCTDGTVSIDTPYRPYMATGTDSYGPYNFVQSVRHVLSVSVRAIPPTVAMM
jgi:hypothetical protein